MLGKAGGGRAQATSSPSRARRSGSTALPGAPEAPEVERPGAAPRGARRGTQRPLQGGSGRALRLPDAARLTWAGRIVAVALALGMLLSPALWLTRSGASLSESFPQVPPLSGMGLLALPTPLDIVLYGAVLALCALAAALPGRRLVLGALFGALVLITLPDVMRWQPWVYLYGLALGTLVLPALPGRSGAVLRVGVLRMIVASVYLYSGLNKVNSAFYSEGLAGFLGGMPEIVGSGPVAEMMTYSAPVLEMAAGAGLLLGGLAGMRRVRYAALGLAVSTNLFVLVALVAASANVVVWPWNAAMIALVPILFAGEDRKEGLLPQTSSGRATSGNVAGLRGSIYALVIVALAAVMPLFGVLGYWPSYLSWALYSENTSGAVLAIPGPPGAPGLTTVTALSYERLRVPAFPAQAVYLELGKQACGGREVVPVAPGGSGAAVLTVEGRPDIRSGTREIREYSCPG